ncbi:MAG: SUMF1/EgtB/PvdO family nonheme iron enzyme [Alphaproteobacteria bacterium]|nr:SUMF1/EgtB/PvdO family nonheme iron enzyme [Alphaproteobacteria bacterium]MBT4082384.1 SUMF1/EgtB/PvdO family nonheme iron enzyme [Alphaproteobacteria bacterium]MBT4545926.1 SUMF1/EgtB/PvdO family nonheme iron enzyme [Alphaproteobacteria bacterium]MBT7745062.1 SUMF1/EgtB/PvdO family nonheme iron enzyme [Alphaproteobacteria bacterium]
MQITSYKLPTIMFVIAIGFAAAFILPRSSLAIEVTGVPGIVNIPSGSYVFGSDKVEREAAYRLDEQAYGHRVTRQQGWYDSERHRQRAQLGAFSITRTPVTNAQYADFVRDTGHPAPDIDELTWKSYGLIHAYPATRRFAWVDGKPPAGREDHPVVLISHADAKAYALWLGRQTKSLWRLPTEAEWEKAARGSDGSRFPWGDIFDASLLNSADRGPFDTMPVGSFPEGASPAGMLDVAGQVFEWTATRSGRKHFIVKGGSWDDKGCGVCRPAARHARPADLKHILIGFRLVNQSR